MGTRGSTWAEQWDYNNPDPAPETQTGGGDGGRRAKYSKKLGEGLAKTKAAASTGMKKVKGGASMGIHWIKDKCHKTTNK